MKTGIPNRIYALVAVAAIVASACSSVGTSTSEGPPTTPAPAPGIELVAATIGEIGVTTVVPNGWDVVPGTALFRGEDARVAFGAVPSWAAPDPAAVGLALADRRQFGGLWWDLYSAEVGEAALLLAITPVAGADYFAEFVMPVSRADHYLDAVATPVLEAFEVDAPAGIGGDLDLRSAAVDGRAVAYAVGGAGDPTVVFEAGLGDSMAVWGLVAPPVAASAHVFVYDRPGYGRSDPTTAPRDAATIVAELRELLITTGHEPPYVLVGHSLGGTVMDYFARNHPDEVSGLVLVDSRHHDYTARCLAQLGDAGGCEIPEEALDQVPPHMRAEWAGLTATEQQFASAPPPDEELDLVVVTAGVPDADATPAGWQLWQETQRDYARSVPGARQIVAEDSDHLIPGNRPEVIVEAINELLGGNTAPQQ